MRGSSLPSQVGKERELGSVALSSTGKEEQGGRNEVGRRGWMGAYAPNSVKVVRD